MRLRPKVLLWTAIAAYAVGFAALSILQYRAYNAGRFDLGNMAQAVWAAPFEGQVSTPPRIEEEHLYR